MGMTKALQERLFISANLEAERTRFVCVRYGNVLASRGSVVPLFMDQIRSGGPVTVTHEKMTRFLLSLEDAVDTVLAALVDARAGDVFVPICATARMLDLATVLIGDRTVSTKITGIRPGEKMHESLISDEEAIRTIQCGEYYAIGSMLPELARETMPSPSPLAGEYSSCNNTITKAKIFALLKKHGLLMPTSDRELNEVIG